MKRACAFFILFSASFLYAHEHVSVSVETGGGILFGQAHEYVVSAGGKVISRLDWQENWIPYIIAAPRFNFFNFFITADFLCTLPLGLAGNIMEDYDYLSENRYAEFTAKFSG